MVENGKINTPTKLQTQWLVDPAMWMSERDQLSTSSSSLAIQPIAL
jgi:hypothetical protein